MDKEIKNNHFIDQRIPARDLRSLDLEVYLPYMTEYQRQRYEKFISGNDHSFPFSREEIAHWSNLKWAKKMVAAVKSSLPAVKAAIAESEKCVRESHQLLDRFKHKDSGKGD